MTGLHFARYNQFPYSANLTQSNGWVRGRDGPNRRVDSSSGDARGGRSLILSLFGGPSSVLFFPFVPAAAAAELVPWVFGCLVFIFPIAAYCLFLAMINGRHHPTLISGPWDFVGVLLALSGFLLVGGPSILLGFQARTRASMVRGNLPTLHDLGAANWSFWAAVWIAYFLFVLAAALWLLWRRRGVTLVYNVEPGLFDELLAHALSNLKLESSRTANRVYISRSDREPMTETTGAIQAERGFRGASPRLAVDGPTWVGHPLDSTAIGRACLELDPFAAMSHVTLRWRGDASLREDVEAELGRQLADVITPENPAAGWLLTIATCLFGVLLLGLVAFLFLLWHR